MPVAGPDRRRRRVGHGGGSPGAGIHGIQRSDQRTDAGYRPVRCAYELLTSRVWRSSVVAGNMGASPRLSVRGGCSAGPLLHLSGRVGFGPSSGLVIPDDPVGLWWQPCCAVVAVIVYFGACGDRAIRRGDRYAEGQPAHRPDLRARGQRSWLRAHRVSLVSSMGYDPVHGVVRAACDTRPNRLVQPEPPPPGWNS